MENTNNNLVQIVCADCGRVITEVTQEELDNFLTSHDDDFYEAFGNHIVLWDGKFYCESCQDCFDECVECGELINTFGEGQYVYGEGWFCEDCIDRYLTRCNHCGSCVREDDARTVYENTSGGGLVERIWCDDCARRYAWQCSECDEWFSDNVSSNRTVHDDYICNTCRDDHYYCCDGCDEYVHVDDAYSDDDNRNHYCETCWNRREESSGQIIYGYHDYPSHWEFRNHETEVADYQTRHKSLHIGIESELDRGGYSHENALRITTAMGYPANESLEFKCSRDGSLNDGFEIISMPATLEYHLQKYKWEAGMKEAVALGYESHDANTCGLHFHFDREYFKDSMTNPEEAFVILASNNTDWLKRFSRRTKYDYCAFVDAAPFVVDDFKTTDPDKQVITQGRLDNLRRCYRGHGSALNFANYGTIEIRFIRGTLKYSTFVASLQLMEMLGYAVKHFRKEQLVNIDLKWFKRFANRKGYAEFITYLAERGIMA